jgi:Helix-turn-helix
VDPGLQLGAGLLLVPEPWPGDCHRIRRQVLHEQSIGISQNYLSTMERGKVQIGSKILLKISREFGKSIEWLLTGEEQN